MARCSNGGDGSWTHAHVLQQPVINRRASAMHTASKRLSATRPGCPSVLSLVANVAFYVHGTEVISTEYSTFIGYTVPTPVGMHTLTYRILVVTEPLGWQWVHGPCWGIGT